MQPPISVSIELKLSADTIKQLVDGAGTQIANHDLRISTAAYFKPRLAVELLAAQATRGGMADVDISGVLDTTEQIIAEMISRGWILVI